jgi:integrase
MRRKGRDLVARGSVLKRRQKSGKVTYSIKFRTADGTQIKRAIGPSRAQAEQALNAGLAATDRGELISPSRITFGEAADAWLSRKKPVIEASTYRDYETHLRMRLKPSFGELKLRQITRGRIEDYLAELDEAGELSRKTINDSLIPLRQVLARATRDGAIARNPASSGDRDDPLELPYERPAMRALTREQARAYLDACPGWYRPLAEVLLGAGLRVGEAIALEWSDIDWDAGAILVTKTVKVGGVGTPKGDKTRSVAVADYLLEVLREHRAGRGALGGPVFPHPTPGLALTRHAVRRRGHMPAVEDAGLPVGVRLHDLRHTAATLWLAAGASIYFVQQQLGHADIKTTIDLYGHPDQAAHRQAAERVAAWWREGVDEGPPVPRAVPQAAMRPVSGPRSPVTSGLSER